MAAPASTYFLHPEKKKELVWSESSWSKSFFFYVTFEILFLDLNFLGWKGANLLLSFFQMPKATWRRNVEGGELEEEEEEEEEEKAGPRKGSTKKTQKNWPAWHRQTWSVQASCIMFFSALGLDRNHSKKTLHRQSLCLCFAHGGRRVWEWECVCVHPSVWGGRGAYYTFSQKKENPLRRSFSTLRRRRKKNPLLLFFLLLFVFLFSHPSSCSEEEEEEGFASSSSSSSSSRGQQRSLNGGFFNCCWHLLFFFLGG